MAKKTKSKFQLYQDNDQDILQEVQLHFKQWQEDNDRRRTRRGGWDDVTDAYWGKLPIDWPYTNKIVDPRIRTSVNEKDDRILNAKLRGRLVPREGGDMVKAKINNTVLDFQWDNANDGGSMLSKLKQMSQDTRLYASKFALIKWKYEKDAEGKCIFNGNEMKPLDIRDSGMDPTADHIRNAKWFHVRDWAKLDDLENIKDTIVDPNDKEKFDIKLAKLKNLVDFSYHSDRRDTRYPNRLLSLKGLTDRVGSDRSYPIVEVVTEYRTDRWITFCPRYNIILRDIPNPYNHNKIPVGQLRYYAIQGDSLGESEVEPVLGLWRAIQAILNGFLDSYSIHIRPPLKIIDGQVRIETIVYGPEAQMIMNRADAVTEFQSSGEAIRYFQAAYQAAISAFNTGMGDISQGVSAIDPTETKKTATEIKQSSKQQNVRDQANQNALADFLQDMMSMWLVNNKQFLFDSKEGQEYVMRIVGKENFDYFRRAGMQDMETSPEALQAVGDIIHQQGGNVSDEDINTMIQSGAMPKYPVLKNPTEKNPSNYNFAPKLSVSEMGDSAELTMVPEDLEGDYDYVADVESMASGAQQDMIQGRQQALETFKDPQILQLIAMDQKRPKITELLTSMFDGLGLDGERMFEDAQPQPPQLPPGAPPQPGVPGQPGQPPQPQIDPQTGQPLPVDNLGGMGAILEQGSQHINDQQLSNISGQQQPPSITG